MIDDPRKWRISKSGFSIRTGWGNEKILICKYAGPSMGEKNFDTDFQKWVDNAEQIVDLYNTALPALNPPDSLLMR